MNNKSFTLLELVVVVIILGILATLGYNQYSLVVEKSRTAEAMARIGVMRTLTHEYYLKNGSLTGIQNSDVGVDWTCTNTDFYRYAIGTQTALALLLAAGRCTSGGKAPDASREYTFYLFYYPALSESAWYCYYTDDLSPCFGFLSSRVEPWP